MELYVNDQSQIIEFTNKLKFVTIIEQVKR